MAEPALRIADLSDSSPGWRWIADLMPPEPPIDWRFYTTARGKILSRVPGPHWGRVGASLALRLGQMRRAADLVIAHGPRNAYYAASLGAPRSARTPIYASDFNFTDLPTGYRLAAMRKAFARIDRFAVYSRMERDLYAELFDLPVDRFHFVHWGVTPPIGTPLPRVIDVPYVAAIGGEARDYATLIATARRLPKLRFVIVARPSNLAGLDLPSNVTAFTNHPHTATWSLIAHAEVALVPLRSKETPNGHVTIVGGMHLGKAQIVTDSSGIHDYIEDGVTGLLVPQGDDGAFAAAIERLLDDAALRGRIGAAAKAFAGEFCSERTTVDFAFRQILDLTGRSAGA